MAFPTIHFNPATGSDTAASGAGPGDGVTAGTVITGAGAASTAGASTVINLTGAPDLSAVLTTGVHAIWLNTASGRQWSLIVAKDNAAKTVTVEDSFNIATAVTYAIGGKRKTLDAVSSRLLFTDVKPNWTIDLEDGTYVMTSRLDCTAGGVAPITLMSSTPVRATVTTATNSTHLFGLSTSAGRWRFKHLLFTNTATTKGEAVACLGGYPAWAEFIDCVCDGCLSLCLADNAGAHYAFGSVLLQQCEIKNCTGRGFANAGSLFVLGCYFHDNASDGLAGGTTANNQHFIVIDSIFANNGGRGIIGLSQTQNHVRLANCTFANNTSHGVDIDIWSDSAGYVDPSNCIFYGNGGYGLRIASAYAFQWGQELNCAYGANVSGPRLNFPVGPGAVTLTADPFTNSAARDFTLNATAGGGAACRGAGFPGAWPSATMTGAPSLGALQPASSGGSGLATTIYNSTGNFNGASVSSLATSPLATVAGNLLVVATRSGLSIAVTSITDTAGNTYVKARTVTSNGTSFEFWYCLSALAHASNVITANFASATTNNSILVAQVAGLTTPTIYTDLSHAALYPAALTSNADVGVKNQILIVAAQIDATGTTWTPGTGFTTLDQDSGHVVYMEYAIATSTLLRLIPAATLGGPYSGVLIGALFGDAVIGGGGAAAGGSYGFA